MDPASDSRIAAFKRFVEEANGLCHHLNAAEHDELVADDTATRLANPGKGDDLESLQRFRAGLGDIAVLRSRHAAAKLRFQLHLGKGRKIKQAAVEAVREILLSAVGGEASLTTCPIGPFAQHYLDEVRKVGSWSSPGATLQQVSRHLSEALETLERAISESDLIRRDRDDPPRWMVERFEANRWKAALRSRLARRPGRAIQSPVKK
jgi:hypothetical protein